jgi:hypothetical protein
MKNFIKSKMRMPIDLAMLILMPFLMSYSLVGETAHEWIGIAITVLFIVHQILNFGWWKNIFKGKMSAVRILITSVNFLLLADIILLAYSGINLSEHIFSALPEIGSSSFSRVLHLTCAHWGIVLTSLHLGFHGRIIGRHLKHVKMKNTLLAIGGLIGIYGIYAFVGRRIYSYLFPTAAFIFFDGGTSLVRSLADYGAMIVTFAYIGYFAIKIATNKSKTEKE